MKTQLARAALVLAFLVPLGAHAQVSVSIAIAPPPLPVYAQPPVPGDGYVWTPGYWVWSATDADYYWAPGTWTLAPSVGDLWTPGYWGVENAAYFWHIGYWGPTVGFYGGLNYGYGYSGSGYQGGRWDHGAFRYNRAVSNVNINVVHNVYSAPLVNRAQATRVSFNGGAAGSHAQPTASERQMQAAEHAGPTPEQVQHEHQALTMSTQRAAVNHGVPPVAATPRPSAFAEPGVEQAKAAAVARTRQPGPTPREPVAAQSPPRPEAAPQREPPQLHAQVQQRAPQERAAPRAEPASRGEQQPRQEEPRR